MAGPTISRAGATRLSRLRPTTLTARLVAMVVLIVMSAAVVIAVASTLATRAYLVDRLDSDVRAALARTPPGPPPRSIETGGRTVDADGDGRGGDVGSPGDEARGASVGTLTAYLAADGSGRGLVLVQDDDTVRYRDLGVSALATLGDVSTDGRPGEVHLDGLGSYQVAATAAGSGDARSVVVAGLPLDGVEAVTGRLVAVELVLAAGVALAALGAGTVLVRRQLRPLREVAGTAREVAALPLASGEIDLAPRVPERLADERTEVGRVGSALNTLLAHVESSLDARHRSEQQVRQFVADASHELRTPLATIAGYTELARRRPDDDVALRTALGKVEEESGRMTALVEDLLLLARLDSGRPLERRPVDLTRLLVEAVADIQVVAPEHRWRLDVPETPVEIEGDEQRLHQVVTNLLTNARKYTPPGTVVTVRAGAEGFSVHDDGPGFAPEVAARAFERFVRADPSRHRGSAAGRDPGTSAGGVGLGLSLVEAVVGAHGGTVSLRSVPGDTEVDVALPQ